MINEPTPRVRAFWITGPAQGEIQPTNPDLDAPDSEATVEVATLYTGISRGTESLVFNGRIPRSEHERMRAPFQAGDFPWPVRHGYSNVGRVVQGPAELEGRIVFSLFPHQTRFRLPASAAVPVPDGVPAERAILAANMETAINGLWDASAAIGERIAIVGCGVVGALMAWLCQRLPGTRVTAVDMEPSRRRVLEQLGVHFDPDLQSDDHDLVFHASGNPKGLEHALALAGTEGRIIEMSWYGDQPVSVPLGGAFHSRRLTLRASQVGRVSPERRPAWTHRGRLELALSLLANPELDVLIDGESDFEALPETMAALCRADSSALCHRVRYPENH
ncbi:zinc-dependent alcohol dehydrogenase [Vreelandella utahensis]|uniref:zinc-dependent alcohol dehydrogenase n=1 Tax=Vreelandella halophila TaxID=86177 RepID=UPI0009876C5A|nr:zinc-binding alcohol dehydrogenase [Halomonas utahensis]